MLVIAQGIVVGMALWLSSGAAFAQAPFDPANVYKSQGAFDKFMTLAEGTGKHTVGMGTNGTPIVTSGVPGPTQVGNMNIGHTAGGMPEIRGSAQLPTPSPTTKLPIDVRVPLAAGTLGPALLNFAKRVFTPLTVGFAIMDLFNELGFGASRNGAGELLLTRDTAGVIDGFDYANDAVTPTVWYASATQACTARIAARNASVQTAGTWVRYDFVSVTQGAANMCRVNTVYQNCTNCSQFNQNDVAWQGNPTRPKTIFTTSTIPATHQEFLDAVAAKSGWPAASKVSPALADAVNAGEGVKVAPGTVTTTTTTIVGPTTTTTNNDNSTKVTVQTWNVTTVGPVVTYRENLKVTDTTPAGVTSTATTNKPVEEKTITCGLPDTPKCKIDETGTPADKAATFTQAETELDAQKTAAIAEVAKAAVIPAPAWSFTFALPTGCSSYATGIKNIVISVCSFQSTFHDLMSMIWAAVTAFAMMGMVGRTIREA